jgi:hypothetical protein
MAGWSKDLRSRTRFEPSFWIRHPQRARWILSSGLGTPIYGADARYTTSPVL